MIRLLMGGSPCTYWSIAQKNNRETEANGIGWELFKNYLIAKEKFKPDYFLYENNVSAAQPIKCEIRNLLNVYDGTFLMPYSDVRYIEINSALVSAQNRERFYVHNCGEVEQPKDRGILLKDVLGSGYDLTSNEKSYALTASYNGAIPSNTIERKQRNMVIEPCIFQQGHGYNDGGMKYGKCPTLTASPSGAYGNQVVEPIRIPEYTNSDKSRPVLAGYCCKGDGDGSLLDKCFTDNPNKQKVDYIAEPIAVNTTATGKAKCLKATYGTKDGMRNLICNETERRTCVAEPVRVGTMPQSDGTVSESKQWRIYGVDGKSTALCANGGGGGAKTGLYAVPLERYNYATEFDSEGNPTKAYCYADGKIHTVYVVKDGKITIKGREYIIELPDMFCIIRKLTVAECRRLQTIPDWYKMPCSDTQNYKMLGNGWTVEVIKHILSHIPNITTEPIEVLSMYDGMSGGQIALKELGANVIRYYATEIDKYAIQTTQANFPDTIQLGDAFQVRDENWAL